MMQVWSPADAQMELLVAAGYSGAVHLARPAIRLGAHRPAGSAANAAITCPDLAPRLVRSATIQSVPRPYMRSSRRACWPCGPLTSRRSGRFPVADRISAR